MANAVVIGASMAGCLAARVLAERFDTVTVLERDALHDEPGHRRGVPQGRHGHLLLAGGAQAIESLLPGTVRDLTAAGVPVIGAVPGDVHSAHPVTSSTPTAGRVDPLRVTCPAGLIWSGTYGDGSAPSTVCNSWTAPPS